MLGCECDCRPLLALPNLPQDLACYAKGYASNYHEERRQAERRGEIIDMTNYVTPPVVERPSPKAVPGEDIRGEQARNADETERCDPLHLKDSNPSVIVLAFDHHARLVVWQAT